MTDLDPLLAAGFDPDGAYGPTVVMQLASRNAATWLRQIFLDVAAGQRRVQLSDEPGVRLDGFDGIEVALAGDEDNRELVKRGNGSNFAWHCSPDRWRRNAGLLDPFVEGRTGHQYLTSEETDDALIEVSFGELHPGL